MYSVVFRGVKKCCVVGRFKTLKQAKEAFYPPEKYGIYTIFQFGTEYTVKRICFKWIGSNEWVSCDYMPKFKLIHGGLHGSVDELQSCVFK